MLEPDEKWKQGVRALEDQFKFYKLLPRNNAYGMFLYSKFKLEDLEVRYLIDENVPSLYTKFSIDNSSPVHLFCLHPRPPRPGESSSLQRDAELIKVAKEVKEINTEPAFVIGDLNDVAWSHTTRLFKRLSETLDPRVGRGFLNTFPASSKIFSFPLDHVFHTKKLGLKEMKVLRNIGSDHRPISISFEILERGEESSSPECADSEDKEEAKSTEQESKKWDGPVKEVDS